MSTLFKNKGFMENINKDKKVIEFVGNFNCTNFKELKHIVIDSVKTIMTVASLSMLDMEKLTGIHHDTLKNILILERVGIFRTYSKLNMFVKSVIIADEKKDKHFGFDEIKEFVLDENLTGDIN